MMDERLAAAWDKHGLDEGKWLAAVLDQLNCLTNKLSPDESKQATDLLTEVAEFGNRWVGYVPFTVTPRPE